MWRFQALECNFFRTISTFFSKKKIFFQAETPYFTGFQPSKKKKLQKMKDFMAAFRGVAALYIMSRDWSLPITFYSKIFSNEKEKFS
jgi:hypothetical protein